MKEAIGTGRPYLGICLGLQLLFERSDEGAGAEGLGIVRGTVKRFPSDGARTAESQPLKIPHMGWNEVNRSPQPASHENRGGPSAVHRLPTDCPMLEGIADGSFFYFVHSYYGEPADRSVVALETEYGIRFTSMVWRDNLFATQFHPEKSQSVGLRLLRNFVELS